MAEFEEIVDTDTMDEMKGKINGNFVIAESLSGGRDAQKFIFRTPQNPWICTIVEASPVKTVQIYEEDGQMVIPNKVIVIDDNTIRIEFASLMDGYAIIGF